MSTTWATFLFEAANFLLLAAVLGWLFFRPVRAILERRRDELESERRAAEAARAEAERAADDTRARRGEIEASLQELRERIRHEAETEREELLQQARARMERERETLKADLASLRLAQARALGRDAAFAAREIVVGLLGKMEGPELEQTLLRTACREVEKLRSSGRLAPLVVEAARPLDDADLAAVAEAAGVDRGEVTQRAISDLVAGVRILTARGVVDASAAGLAARAEERLRSRLERDDADGG